MFPDDRLRLIFTCCHPALATDAQVALTLHTICGITAEEISQRVSGSRSRPWRSAWSARNAKFATRTFPIASPRREDLPDRLDATSCRLPDFQ